MSLDQPELGGPRAGSDAAMGGPNEQRGDRRVIAGSPPGTADEPVMGRSDEPAADPAVMGGTDEAAGDIVGDAVRGTG